MASNPNTFAGIRETWDKVYQVTHHKMPVYPAFANFRLAPQLEVGDTVNRHYRSTMYAYPMQGDGTYQRQALTDTQEQLVVNAEFESSTYIKTLDEIQNHLPTRAEYARDAAMALFNRIDGDVLGEYSSFSNSVDDSTLGGTSGNGIVLTTSNVRQLFSNATKLLQRNNIKLDNQARFTGVRRVDAGSMRGVAVLSPDVYQTLLESLEGKESSLGDTVALNGHAGRYFGYDIFVSNAVGWSATLAMGSTDFSDGDTVVINGVTLTLKSSLGTTAGNVLIGASVADTIDALVACINDSESLAAFNGGAGADTAGTDYVELSVANRALLLHITATDGTTEMTLKAEGYGFIAVSETATPSDVLFTAAKQIQHCLIGVSGAVDLVVQKTPNLNIKDRDGKVGKDIVTWSAWGLKTFNDATKKMIDVQIRTDGY